MGRLAGPRGRLSEPVLLKLTPEQREELEAASFGYRVSEPEIVRRALDEFLRNRRAELKKLLKAREGIQPLNGRG